MKQNGQPVWATLAPKLILCIALCVACTKYVLWMHQRRLLLFRCSGKDGISSGWHAANSQGNLLLTFLQGSGKSARAFPNIIWWERESWWCNLALGSVWAQLNYFRFTFLTSSRSRRENTYEVAVAWNMSYPDNLLLRFCNMFLS